VDLARILAELRHQRQQIDEAIRGLEHLPQGAGRRRGRPPKWMSEVAKKGRGRPPGTKNKPTTNAGAEVAQGKE
jgi:hypothetical protein